MSSMMMRTLVLALVLASTSNLVAARDTLQIIRDYNEVRLGYRSSSVPFSVLGQDGKPHGYSIDLCSVIVK